MAVDIEEEGRGGQAEEEVELGLAGEPVVSSIDQPPANETGRRCLTSHLISHTIILHVLFTPIVAASRRVEASKQEVRAK